MATILIVEDNLSNMRLVALLLEKAGHRVLQALTATVGVDLARRAGPDLILMDVQLPGMDGLAATRLLKSDPATRGIKVIALTAFAMKGDEERMLSAGCDGYIAKPIQYKDFLVQVEAQLAGDHD